MTEEHCGNDALPCDRIEWVVDKDMRLFIRATMAWLWSGRWYKHYFLIIASLLWILSGVLVAYYKQEWAAVTFILMPGVMVAPVGLYRGLARLAFRRHKPLLPYKAWLDQEGIGAEGRSVQHSWSSRYLWTEIEGVVETPEFFFMIIKNPKKNKLFIPKTAVEADIASLRVLLEAHNIPTRRL